MIASVPLQILHPDGAEVRAEAADIVDASSLNVDGKWPELMDDFGVLYYTDCVSLKLICASLNVKLCIFKVHCQENHCQQV